MNTADPTLPSLRLTAKGRIWLLVGRMFSPVSAFLLLLGGIIFRRGDRCRAALQVLSGTRTLVGPSCEMKCSNGRVLTPGILSEVRTFEQVNLPVDSAAIDRQYVAAMGPKKDLAVLLKGTWASLLDRGTPPSKPTEYFNLFDVIVNNSEIDLIIKTIEDMTLGHPNHMIQLLGSEGPEPSNPIHVTFVNANNFNIMLDRRDYKKALQTSQLVLPDGIGVKLALQMAGGSLRRNLNGTDLFPFLADLFERQGWSLFLLGATDKVLQKASSKITTRNKQLRIAGTRNGYFKTDDEKAICDEINASGAMVLLVGMGTPRQELFVARNIGNLKVPLVLSMGGLIDFLGEKNRRAPIWMRQVGMEWVFRLLQEPQRMWRRYLIGNPVFLWRARRWIRGKDKSTSQKARRNK